jgi:diaminohydroxyphosphoribosylaminopyrimidine deaminase/5-amino-6-(5-phosphoribosylamino)uracil reductase
VALIGTQLARVVVAAEDPFDRVSGSGIAQLREAKLAVDLGVLEQEARELTAPYRKLIEQRRPWVLAKWAMTLDGKIATRTGDSRWISGESARRLVHGIRGRVDAVMIGLGTALRDDPELTCRPPGPRCAVRVVVDSSARLPPDSRLVRTIGSAPLLVAVACDAPVERCSVLEKAGAEVVRLPGQDRRQRLDSLLDELGRRRMTNVLVEGGGELIGELLDAGHLDEVLVVVAPRLVGGRGAVTPAAGVGIARIQQALLAGPLTVERLGEDICLRGRLSRHPLGGGTGLG